MAASCLPLLAAVSQVAALSPHAPTSLQPSESTPLQECRGSYSWPSHPPPCDHPLCEELHSVPYGQHFGAFIIENAQLWEQTGRGTPWSRPENRTHLWAGKIWDGGDRTALLETACKLSRKWPTTKFIILRADNADALLPDIERFAKQAVLLTVSTKRSVLDANPRLRLVPTPYTGEFVKPIEYNTTAQLTPWSQRESIAFWRGRPTTMVNPLDPSYYPRYQILAHLQGYERADVGFVYPEKMEKPVGERADKLICYNLFPCELLSPQCPAYQQWDSCNASRFLNTSLWSGPAFKQRVPMVQQLGRYKAMFAFDGWSWPTVLHSTLLSGSVPILASEYLTGFLEELTPNVHYVPIMLNGSDAVSQLETLWADDARAQRIAETARRDFDRLRQPEHLVRRMELAMRP